MSESTGLQEKNPTKITFLDRLRGRKNLPNTISPAPPPEAEESGNLQRRLLASAIEKLKQPETVVLRNRDRKSPFGNVEKFIVLENPDKDVRIAIASRQQTWDAIFAPSRREDIIRISWWNDTGKHGTVTYIDYRLRGEPIQYDQIPHYEGKTFNSHLSETWANEKEHVSWTERSGVFEAADGRDMTQDEIRDLESMIVDSEINSGLTENSAQFHIQHFGRERTTNNPNNSSPVGIPAEIR